MNKDPRRTTDCTIIIPSCDKYTDLWRPFFTLLFTYWPDCPFPVCLGSNHMKYDDVRVRTIAVGQDEGWSDGAIKMLQSVKTPYVLIILDDFFIRSQVVTENVLDCLEALRQLDGHMLRLLPKHRPDFSVPGFPKLGRIDNENCAPYCVSLQAAIWNRQSLLALMRKDESIWEFEVNGTRRAVDMSPGFFTTRSHVLDYGRHAVQAGKWFLMDARRYGRMGIGCDFSRRSVTGLRTELAWWNNRVKRSFFELISWKTRRRISSFFRKIKRTVFPLIGNEK